MGKQFYFLGSVASCICPMKSLNLGGSYVLLSPGRLIYLLQLAEASAFCIKL